MSLSRYCSQFRTGRSLLLLVVFSACRAPDAAVTEEASASDHEASAERVATGTGLVYEIVEIGTGPAAAPGELALIHEVTRLGDGTVVSDTYALNSPIEF